MQATMNPAASLPRLQFARRDYMMRSEKRRRPDQSSPGHGQDRPPKKRRPRAGIPYKILTLVLLLLVWPIGLIPLWRRKLRWSTLTKIFVSIATLLAFVLLFLLALTIETGNPNIAAVQDDIDARLTVAIDATIDLCDRFGERVKQSAEALDELIYLYGTDARNAVADRIDQGVAFAQVLRGRADTLIDKIFHSNPPEAADEADESLPAPGETGASANEAPTPAPTSVPAAEILVGAEDEELPVYIPGGAPADGSGSEIASGILTRAGTLDEGALPTPTPEPTPEPDPVFYVKPAGEATVYFNIGSGHYYHMTNVCGPMKDADAHSFAETAENIHEPCERCTPPDKSLLEEEYIVWLDEGGIAHLSDECARFAGQWSLESAQAAIEADHAGCPDCGADAYLAALAEGRKIELSDVPVEPVPTPKPTAEPTPEPTPGPTIESTPAPTAEPTPNATVKPTAKRTTSPTMRPMGEMTV